MTTTSTTIQLHDLPAQPQPEKNVDSKWQQPQRLGSFDDGVGTASDVLQLSRRSCESVVEPGELRPNERSVEVVEKWNEPRINAYRVPATFWSLLVMATNDAAYGVSKSRKPVFFSVSF